MCPHEQKYNTNSDQDELALQDKLESLLVLNLDELNWLKGKLEWDKDQISAHLEKQEHPGDAEADEGALNKAGQPQQRELQDCNHKGRWESKGLEV